MIYNDLSGITDFFSVSSVYTEEASNVINIYWNTTGSTCHIFLITHTVSIMANLGLGYYIDRINEGEMELEEAINCYRDDSDDEYTQKEYRHYSVISYAHDTVDISKYIYEAAFFILSSESPYRVRFKFRINPSYGTYIARVINIGLISSTEVSFATQS